MAANYNFVLGGKVHFFQSGMVQHENKHLRLGLILHSYCIEEAIREGLTEYDFLKVGQAGAEYKDMWGNCSRDLLDIRISRASRKEAVLQGVMNLMKSLKIIRQKWVAAIESRNRSKGSS